MITFLEFITESEFRSKLIPALRNLDVPVDHKKHILKGKRGWTHQETAEHHGIGPDNRIKGELGYWHTGKHKFYPKHNSDFDGEEGLNIDSTELDPRAGSVALMRRLEEGNPLSQDLKHRRKGIHKIIISAARKNLPDKKNKKRMKTLYKRLKASGAVFKKTKGVWQNAAGEIENEKSVMAHLPNDPTGEKIVSLGHKLRRKYNQDTFIHRTPG
jgi:hypothetical protein